MTLSLSRSMSPRTTIDNGNDSLLEKSPKKFRSTNSWLESKKIQNALEERKALLEEKRVEKLAQLSQGEWIPSSHVVKVTKNVGRHWATMGHTYLGELYLDPEEALFLLEANTIEIYFNGLPMSLQQAYSILLGSESGCTLEEYRAFAHLTRFGYKVRRHRPEIGGKRKRDEPLEIDVVGVIRRKKSSDTGGPENVVEVEDAIEVVDSVEATGASSVRNIPLPPACSVKKIPLLPLPLPSTSQVSNIVAPPADDDDIKFLEIVDTSKKRKVLSSVLINDNIEISLAGDGCGNNASSALASNMEQSDAQKKEGFNSATQKMPAVSFHSISDCELVEDCSHESRPSRGMYKRNLFAPSTSCSKFPESSSSATMPSSSRNNCRSEGKTGSENEKTDSAKAGETSDEVIVLSDDETKEDSKQAKELLRFYKEISLIELIDISEEDEEGKATNKANAVASSRVDENFDFWHVLGRIPTLEKGRMVLRLPAPPSQLIPLNIQPSQNEYVINVATSLQPQPSEGENSSPRQRSERVSSRRGEGIRGSAGRDGTRAAQDRHERSSGGFSQGRNHSDRPRSHSHRDHRAMERSSYLLPAPYASQTNRSNHNLWQQSLSRNSGNTLTASNDRTSFANYYSNPSSTMNCWGGQYRANNGRSLWSSLVYSERQFGGHTNASHQWTASSVTHFHHNAPRTNYQSYGQNSYRHNFYGQTSHSHHWADHTHSSQLHRSRSNQWHGYSSSSHGSRSGGRWQHQSGVWPHSGGSRHFSRRDHHVLPVRRATPQDNRAEDTFSESVIPKVPHARNWLELKIKSEKNKPVEPAVKIKAEICQEDSKEVLPLLKPADSINIDAVQSKLQITSSGKDIYYNGPENYASSLSIKFDLYMPNSNFRKSLPGLPKYRLSIVKSDDRVPKLKDTWYLTKDLNDEVPLLFAVSYTESVNFFSFSNVELPAPMSQ